MRTAASAPEPFAGDPRFLEWTARAAAHDLCNQLLAIQWSSSLLDESREQPAAVRELAQEIDQAVGRARGALSFLSLLVAPSSGTDSRSLDVRDLIDHASNLIRLALGSDAGMEVDLVRCASCRLGVEPRGFVRAMVRLATVCAELQPGKVLTLEAVTCFDSAAGSLQVAIGCPPRGGGPAAAELEARLADLSIYVQRHLNGELSRRGAVWALRVAAVAEVPAARRPGERFVAGSSARASTIVRGSRRVAR